MRAGCGALFSHALKCGRRQVNRKAQKLILKNIEDNLEVMDDLRFCLERLLATCDRMSANAKNSRYLFKQYLTSENDEGGGKPQEIVADQGGPRLRLRVIR